MPKAKPKPLPVIDLPKESQKKTTKSKGLLFNDDEEE